jgi:hypothetical protein
MNAQNINQTTGAGTSAAQQIVDAKDAIYCKHDYNKGPLVCYVHDIREAMLMSSAPELIDALREIELLAREIKRSNNADAIACKCIDVIAKATKPDPIQLTGWTRMA